jgi:hypothetical protein
VESFRGHFRSELSVDPLADGRLSQIVVSPI